MASAAEVLKAAHAPVETVVRQVQLDGQVVLKIMQHCDSALPNIVTGQLLGLDVGAMLEVTDCFPFPVRAAAAAAARRHRSGFSAPPEAALAKTAVPTSQPARPLRRQLQAAPGA
jgi:hypothetical protein